MQHLSTTLLCQCSCSYMDFDYREYKDGKEVQTGIYRKVVFAYLGKTAVNSHCKFE